MISCYRICQLNGERVDTQLELVSGSVRDPHAVNAHLSYGKGGFRYYDFDNNKTFCFGVFLAVVPSFNEKVIRKCPEKLLFHMCRFSKMVTYIIVWKLSLNFYFPTKTW